MIAATPAPPYYAVIFTSLRNDDNAENNTYGHASYAVTAQRMLALATTQPGYLGVESAHENVGITVSYWASLEAIKAWQVNAEHQVAQQSGRHHWYRAYRVRIALVERAYGFDA